MIPIWRCMADVVLGTYADREQRRTCPIAGYADGCVSQRSENHSQNRLCCTRKRQKGVLLQCGRKPCWENLLTRELAEYWDVSLDTASETVNCVSFELTSPKYSGRLQQEMQLKSGFATGSSTQKSAGRQSEAVCMLVSSCFWSPEIGSS